MVEVLVEHDYIAKEPNELTITKGDVVKDVVKKQGGWWEGTLRDKKGLFPDNFVKVLDKDPAVVLRNRKDAARIRQCRVVFSYKQDHEDELNLNVGDIIDILGEEEEGWWRGLLNGKEGVFPSNFVEEIVPVPSKIGSSRENLTNNSGSHDAAPPLFAKPAKTLCEVKFPYKAQNEDELTLKEGDLVTLVSKDGQDPGWWKGELNGVTGVFPDNFVTVLPPLGDDAAPARDDRRQKGLAEAASVKPAATNALRKSPEAAGGERLEAEAATPKVTPPLPGKKPSVPLKKSPSGGSSAGGIFYGLKKKLVDVVDGATGSKVSPPKAEVEGAAPENAFDDVQRRPLLSDVRATRPKAPGRRPPTTVGRDPEPGLVNGNSDHPPDAVPEPPPAANSSADVDPAEAKPKLREWEKHPAPWLEEMKLNQAKRSNPPPPDRPRSAAADDAKPPRKEPSPVDKSRSIAAFRAKTPTFDLPAVRGKPAAPAPSRPQTFHGADALNRRTSPGKAPSPREAPPDGGGDLERRLQRLEELVERQQQSFEAALDELRAKLQLEAELRMKLQVKLERLGLEQL